MPTKIRRILAKSTSYQPLAIFKSLLAPERRALLYLALGRLLLRRGNNLAALQLYRKATTLTPFSTRLWRHHASAAIRAGRLEEASLCYRTLLRLNRDNPRAHACVAASYQLLGASQAALHSCRRALTRFPDSACLHRQLGRLLLSAGAVHSALRSLERAAQLTPSHCETHYFVGLALHRLGRPKEARQALRHALSLRPNDPKLYYALGLCCNADSTSPNESVNLLLSGITLERTPDVSSLEWKTPLK